MKIPRIVHIPWFVAAVVAVVVLLGWVICSRWMR